MGALQGLGLVVAATVMIVDPTGAGEFTPLPGHEYREFFNPPTPVSGISVVGAMLISRTGSVPSDRLWVHFKEPFVGQLDLEIVSADGRFLGRGAFVGSSESGEWVALTLAPEGKRAPRPADPDQETVAVSAQAANRDTVLVAAWGERPTELALSTVRLYVNSRKAPMRIRVDPDPKVPPVACVQLAPAISVRFDTVCSFAAGQLSKDGRVTLIRRDGMQTESQTVVLEL